MIRRRALFRSKCKNVSFKFNVLRDDICLMQQAQTGLNPFQNLALFGCVKGKSDLWQ